MVDACDGWRPKRAGTRRLQLAGQPSIDVMEDGAGFGQSAGLHPVVATNTPQLAADLLHAGGGSLAVGHQLLDLALQVGVGLLGGPDLALQHRDTCATFATDGSQLPLDLV